MNPDKHQAMCDHLATVVMGRVIYDRDPFWYRHKSTGEIAEQTSNWDPFTNHEQAFQCLDTFKNYSVDKDTFDDRVVFTCTIYDDAEIIDADKLHAICIAMCKATGFEEQQRSE